MVLQALDYEESEKKKAFLEQFFESTKGVFRTEKVRALVKHLYLLREGGGGADNNSG